MQPEVHNFDHPTALSMTYSRKNGFLLMGMPSNPLLTLISKMPDIETKKTLAIYTLRPRKR
jgi:hypothetical protein